METRTVCEFCLCLLPKLKGHVSHQLIHQKPSNEKNKLFKDYCGYLNDHFKGLIPVLMLILHGYKFGVTTTAPNVPHILEPKALHINYLCNTEIANMRRTE